MKSCNGNTAIKNVRQTNEERVSIDNAISAFHSGPDFVCTCCHRMMYRKSVVPCNRVKYTTAGTDVLHKVRYLVMTSATLAVIVKSTCAKPVTEP